mgnify:CR=1 FL=1
MTVWVKLRVLVACIAIGPIASAVAAQELNFDIGYTTDCLAVAHGEAGMKACIGKAADACMVNTPGGDSTYGMGGCLSAEADWWDGQLNVAYKALMKREKINDAENGAGAGGPQSAATALRDLQRAWIGFRDATCAYEYAQWGGGTGGGPASVGCFMRLTGEQALYLQTAGFGG